MGGMSLPEPAPSFPAFSADERRETLLGTCDVCGETLSLAAHEPCRRTTLFHCPEPGAYTARLNFGAREIWLRRELRRELDLAWSDLVLAEKRPCLLQVFNPELQLIERMGFYGWSSNWLDPVGCVCDGAGCVECCDRRLP